MTINKQQNTGFSLIEMSVVILVIALLIGGVVTSKTLLRNAEMREMIGEYDRYVKAIQEFQGKYNQLPGDMTNATSMWGADSCPGTAGSSAKIATCNGNGDGKIGTSTTAGVVAAGPASYTEEWFRAWQHLSDSGLIENRYSGTPGTGGSVETNPGLNVPSSKLSKAGWLLMYYLNTGGTTDAWGDTYGHILQLGTSTAGAGARNVSPVMTGSEALDLDNKLDDGKPGTGKVRAWRTNTNSLCTSSDTSQTAATYNTSYSSPACAPFFITGF